jgi:hypothetical protein
MTPPTLISRHSSSFLISPKSGITVFARPCIACPELRGDFLSQGSWSRSDSPRILAQLSSLKGRGRPEHPCNPRFSSSVQTCKTPDALLDGLHKATHSVPSLNVFGAARFPIPCGEWSGFEKNITVFLHKSVAAGWFEEHAELTKRYPGPSITFAQLSMAPFTLTDIMRMMEPSGIDRWPIDLALKYAMRNSFNCPVAGRWVVIFWSPNVLALSEETRAVRDVYRDPPAKTYSPARRPGGQRSRPDGTGIVRPAAAL